MLFFFAIFTINYYKIYLTQISTLYWIQLYNFYHVNLWICNNNKKNNNRFLLPLKNIVRSFTYQYHPCITSELIDITPFVSSWKSRQLIDITPFVSSWLHLTLVVHLILNANNSMRKTSGNVFLGQPHIFRRCTRSWGCSPIPFRISVDHVTIFSSSPMQHVICSSL